MRQGKGLFSSGEIKKHDWKLYECDSWNGKEELVAWGSPDEIKQEMNHRAGKGDDVYIVDCDGQVIEPEQGE